jgi:hypothetical protein
MSMTTRTRRPRAPKIAAILAAVLFLGGNVSAQLPYSFTVVNRTLSSTAPGEIVYGRIVCTQSQKTFTLSMRWHEFSTIQAKLEPSTEWRQIAVLSKERARVTGNLTVKAIGMTATRFDWDVEYPTPNSSSRALASLLYSVNCN